MLYYIQQKKEVKDMKKLLVIIIIAMAYIAGAYTTIVTQEVYATPTGYEVVAYGIFGIMNNKYGKSFMNTS